MDSMIKDLRKQAIKDCWKDLGHILENDLEIKNKSSIESALDSLDNDDYDNLRFYQGFFSALRRVDDMLLEVTGENHD